MCKKPILQFFYFLRCQLLKYGADFEKGMMDLSVNIPLEEALDLGWKILADNFDKGEVGIPTKLSDRFWRKG